MSALGCCGAYNEHSKDCPLIVLKELLALAKVALRKIDEPLKYHHWEEDPYTRAGCFQFIAHEALKAIEKMESER
jgi:hypothetical protein